MIGHVTEVVAFVPKLILFRLSNQLVVAFKEDNMVAFKDMFLKGYKDSTDDTQAIYTCQTSWSTWPLSSRRWHGDTGKGWGHCGA